MKTFIVHGQRSKMKVEKRFSQKIFLACRLYLRNRAHSLGPIWSRTKVQALDQSRPRAVGPSSIFLRVCNKQVVLTFIILQQNIQFQAQPYYNMQMFPLFLNYDWPIARGSYLVLRYVILISTLISQRPYCVRDKIHLHIIPMYMMQ